MILITPALRSTAPFFSPLRTAAYDSAFLVARPADALTFYSICIALEQIHRHAGSPKSSHAKHFHPVVVTFLNSSDSCCLLIPALSLHAGNGLGSGYQTKRWFTFRGRCTEIKVFMGAVNIRQPRRLKGEEVILFFPPPASVWMLRLCRYCQSGLHSIGSVYQL